MGCTLSWLAFSALLREVRGHPRRSGVLWSQVQSAVGQSSELLGEINELVRKDVTLLDEWPVSFAIATGPSLKTRAGGTKKGEI